MPSGHVQSKVLPPQCRRWGGSGRRPKVMFDTGPPSSLVPDIVSLRGSTAALNRSGLSGPAKTRELPFMTDGSIVSP